jgi:hypothetical protein
LELASAEGAEGGIRTRPTWHLKVNCYVVDGYIQAFYEASLVHVVEDRSASDRSSAAETTDVSPEAVLESKLGDVLASRQRITLGLSFAHAINDDDGVACCPRI